MHSIGRADDLLGGLWAVLSTIFVYRDTYDQSTAAALSRIVATTVGILLCLVYLLVAPFHAWALALLIALGVVAVNGLGRPEDSITAGITIAVGLIVAGVDPRHARQEPILRLADTLVGVAVGVAAGWAAQRLTRIGRATAGPS